MPIVDLVYDTGCPHQTEARENLRRAFAAAGLAPEWQEYHIGDLQNPARVRGFGSPTILVDGRDVMGEAPGAETCCRLYDGSRGAPSVGAIAAALSAAAPSR